MSDINRAVEMVMRFSEEDLDLFFRKLAYRGVNAYQMRPEDAYRLAFCNGGTPLFRAIASQSPETAYDYAYAVDSKPHRVTRRGVLSSPEFLIKYIQQIDKGLHPDTTAALMSDHKLALRYAQACGGAVSDALRRFLCSTPGSAFDLAYFVDSEYRKDTWESVKGTDHEEPYSTLFLLPDLLVNESVDNALSFEQGDEG